MVLSEEQFSSLFKAPIERGVLDTMPDKFEEFKEWSSSIYGSHDETDSKFETLIGSSGLIIVERLFKIIKEAKITQSEVADYLLDASYSDLLTIVGNMLKSDVIDIALEAPDSGLFWIYQVFLNYPTRANIYNSHYYTKVYKLARYPKTFIPTRGVMNFKEFYKINDLLEDHPNNNLSKEFQEIILDPFSNWRDLGNNILFSTLVLLRKIHGEEVILELLKRIEIEAPTCRIAEFMFLLDDLDKVKSEPLSWILETADWKEHQLFSENRLAEY